MKLTTDKANHVRKLIDRSQMPGEAVKTGLISGIIQPFAGARLL
jgi:hypothetical protein